MLHTLKFRLMSRFFPVFVTICLSACANLVVPVMVASTPLFVPKSDPDQQPKVLSSDLKIGSLPPQSLVKGTCGLFLWGNISGRPLYFYQNTTRLQTSMMINGDEVSLSRQTANNEYLNGLFEYQEFSYRGLVVKVTIRPDESNNVIQGIPIRSSVINITELNGKQSILSSAGIYGCLF